MDNEQGFLDDLGDWWEEWNDLEDYAVYRDWGTGNEGDYSPGLGNRAIERFTDSEDLADLAGDTLKDGVRRITDDVLGVSPLQLIVILFLIWLVFRKVFV